MYLANEHTTDQCSFADNKDKLIAICEASWKNMLFSSFRKPSHSARHETRQQDFCRGDEGIETRGANGARQPHPQRTSQNNTSALKPSASIAQLASISGCRCRSVRKFPFPHLVAQVEIHLKKNNVVVCNKNNHEDQSEDALCVALVETKMGRAKRDAQSVLKFRRLLAARNVKVMVSLGTKGV